MRKISSILISLLFLPLVSASLTSGEATIVLAAIFSQLILVIFFLILSIIIYSKPMKLFFISLAFLTILFSVGMGVSVMQEFFSTATSLTDTYGQFYILLATLTGGGAIALILYLVIVSFKSFYAYRGLSEDGDYI